MEMPCPSSVYQASIKRRMTRTPSEGAYGELSGDLCRGRDRHSYCALVLVIFTQTDWLSGAYEVVWVPKGI